MSRFGVRAVLVAVLLSAFVGGVADPPRASGFTPRAPILIEGDGDFTGGNGVVGGSGTAADPYVIEGWEINASAGHGIWIRNTTAHFLVRDVYVHSGGGTYGGAVLQNVTNGTIRNGTFEGNRYGVLVTDSAGSPSRNVTVAWNKLTANEAAIAAMNRASDVAIVNNSVGANTREGIVLSYARNVTVSGNNVTDSLSWGIYVADSDSVLVSWNRVFRNPGTGILVSRSTRSTLDFNRVTQDEIRVADSEGIDLSQNGVVGGDGLTVSGSRSLSIAENTFASNLLWGVSLSGSIDVAVYHNLFVFNGAWDEGTQNRWDNGYPSGGNFWLEYAGADLCSGPAQDVCPEPDGIGDFPHQFDPDSFDRYPLMDPRSEYVPPGAPALLEAALAGAGASDLRLTWNASADDGRPGGAVEYRVLRAAEAQGPYRAVAVVPANGSATYAYTCAGCGHVPGDRGNAFYKIRAADAANNTADSDLAARFARDVLPGGNLLAVPLLQGDWSLSAILRTVTYDTVRTYRSSDPADPWKAQYASRPGDLGAVAFGDALWVNALAPGTFTIAGLVVAEPRFVLEPGWNLRAYAGPHVRARDDSLGGLPVVWVEAFEPGTPDPYRLRSVAGTDPLVPGDGYWVYVRQRAVWIQD